MTRLGIDVGGTFTDVFVVEDERVYTLKTPSTPEGPDRGVLDGIRKMDALDPDVRNATFLGHGTTVATNAVLEGETAETALVTTEGFRDVLEIGRQDRPDLYDLEFERPAPLVPRRLRFSVSERLGADGEVVTPLDEDAVREVAGRIPDTVEATAVCTLFSFLDDSHERRIAELLSAAGVERVTRSSAVLPEFREYERASTTVINAALVPVMESYLDSLARRAHEFGIDEPWVVMQSNGGLMSARKAAEEPVNTILSGPAAGVKGAQYLASAAGHEDIVTMDMGGTSTDVSLVSGGEPVVTTDWAVDGRPISVPTLDIHTIGAGGGSIAWIDAGGALRVGPKSAGADPGPVAYGRGGTQPTVTDAQIALGRIDPDVTLSGDLSLDAEAARRAIEREVGEATGRDVEGAARGILEVAVANMKRAVRVVSVERGHDPRNFALVAFGGAGPLHAARLAEDLSIPTVLVPRWAGVLSALGLLASDLKHSYVTSRVEPLSAAEPAAIADAFDALVARGRETLADEGVPDERMRFARAFDLRYRGQSFSLTVPSPDGGDVTGETLSAAAERFHEQHRTQYGHASPDEPVELVNLRVDAVGEIPSVPLVTDVGGDLADAVTGTREVWFGEDERETTVYDHARLPTGSSFEGPAIVQASESTTVVHPGQSVEVDERGTLHVATTEGRR